jgi:hypothetical protein
MQKKQLEEITLEALSDVSGGQQLVTPMTENSLGWYNPSRWFGGGEERRSCAISKDAYRQEPAAGRRDRYVLTPQAQSEHRDCRRNHLGLIGD